MLCLLRGGVEDAGRAGVGDALAELQDLGVELLELAGNEFSLGGSFACKSFKVNGHLLLATFVFFHDFHDLEQVRVDLHHLGLDGRPN